MIRRSFYGLGPSGLTNHRSGPHQRGVRWDKRKDKGRWVIALSPSPNLKTPNKAASFDSRRTLKAAATKVNKKRGKGISLPMPLRRLKQFRRSAIHQNWKISCRVTLPNPSTSLVAKAEPRQHIEHKIPLYMIKIHKLFPYQFWR